MKRVLLNLLFVSLAAVLAGCQTSVVDKTGPIDVRTVTVTVAPTVKSVTPIGPAIAATSSQAILHRMPEGVPADVNIRVKQVTYKNPVLSILVGSANSVATDVSIVGSDGKSLAQFDQSVIDQAALNGVIGAAIAIGQDRAAVDRKLASQYANQLSDRIYGPPDHKPKAKRAP